MQRLLLLSLVFGCAHASPPTGLDALPVNLRADISGVVTDATTGAALADAYVQITARAPAELSRAALTDLQGNFTFYGLAPGAYEITGAKFGYEASPAVRVRDQRARLDVRLVPGEVKEGRASIGPVIVPPHYLSGPHPELTPQALSENVEGTLIVDCVINLDGEVKECRVVQHLRYLDEVTLGAMEKRRYRPARIDGEPFATEYRFKFEFRQPQ
jgi:Carboxypeptidase regulatory-like domain/Gram-negative bacterial TonB protein C-terminal